MASPSLAHCNCSAGDPTMRPTRYAIFLIFAVLPVLMTAGCGSSVEKSPAFLKHTKQLETNTKDIQDLKRDAATMYSQVQAAETMRADFQKVSADVGQLMTKGGGSPEANKALEERIQTLESSLQKVNEELAALKASRGGRRAETQAEEAAPAEPAARGEEASTPKQRRTAPPAATRTTHLIKSGETLDQIARTYGVSADQIRAANHIPAGRNPAPGQRIMIPR
ncbi:LysM domain-containing protein [bacterium]|nr:LysM domain-containing protein [bacterium]